MAVHAYTHNNYEARFVQLCVSECDSNSAVGSLMIRMSVELNSLSSGQQLTNLDRTLLQCVCLMDAS